MFETIERPSAGNPMRAAWGARLVDRVNELCAATSPGMLAREGLGGTGAEPTPASRRVRRSSAASDLGCFAIKSITSKNEEQEDAAGETHRGTFDISFANRYYRVGGMTYEFSGDLPTVTAPCVVYLKIDMTAESPSAELTSAANIGKMRIDERKAANYVLPLYAFDGNGSVVTDFRNAPCAAAFEFDPGEEESDKEDAE